MQFLSYLIILDTFKRKSDKPKNMKTIIATIALTMALFAQAAENDGWVSLFNGKDLSGWVKVNDVQCEVNDGLLKIVKGMGWLCYDKEFKDFILELEWRALDEQYDSGIFIRCGKEGKPWPTDGWQINLRYSAVGGLVRGYKNVVPAETPKQPLNKWVKMRIEVKGKKVSLTINDEPNWEFNELDRQSGFIGIQIENKVFEFRNIRIKELK